MGFRVKEIPGYAEWIARESVFSVVCRCHEKRRSSGTLQNATENSTRLDTLVFEGKFASLNAY